jgi:hypothetical protein
VQNRKLVEPLTGSTKWVEFPATATCLGILFDGGANLDEDTFHTQGFSGLTLRLYDPELDKWSMNRLNSDNGGLTPPIVGRFDEQGVGQFEGNDEHADARSGVASPGPPSRRRRLGGSRRSPQTAAAPEKPTGLLTSPALGRRRASQCMRRRSYRSSPYIETNTR